MIVSRLILPRRSAALTLLWALALEQTALGAEPSTEASGGQEAPGYKVAIEQAVTDFQASRWRAARDAFERAHSLLPSARTLRGIGVAAFYEGDVLAAAASLRLALEDGRRPLDAAQRQEVSGLLDTIHQRVAQLVLDVQPQGAVVTVDGERARMSERALLLLPGSHHVVASADGYRTSSRSIVVEAGERGRLVFDLAREGADAPVEDARPVPQASAPIDVRQVEATPSRTSPWRVGAWVTAGVGLTLTGVGAALWAVNRSEYAAIEDRCPCEPRERDALWADAGIDARTTWTRVALGAAGALGVTSVVLFLSEPTPNHSVAIDVSPTRLDLKLAF